MPNWIDRLRRWALPALAALAVAGCARTDPGTTTVRFWAMGREAVVVTGLIREFEAENPGIHVDVHDDSAQGTGGPSIQPAHQRF